MWLSWKWFLWSHCEWLRLWSVKTRTSSLVLHGTKSVTPPLLQDSTNGSCLGEKLPAQSLRGSVRDSGVGCWCAQIRHFQKYSKRRICLNLCTLLFCGHCLGWMSLSSLACCLWQARDCQKPCWHRNANPRVLNHCMGFCNPRLCRSHHRKNLEGDFPLITAGCLACGSACRTCYHGTCGRLRPLGVSHVKRYSLREQLAVLETQVVRETCEPVGVFLCSLCAALRCCIVAGFLTCVV